MIPNQQIALNDSDFEMEDNLTSITYKMLIAQKAISGKTDGLDAVKQAVYKILNTERYEYSIYSQNYGVEFYDLYGEAPAWVCPEIKRRIEEALLQDERIQSVDAFDITIGTNTIDVKFVVYTVYGDIEIERQVDF